jgi:hypothetical protein
MNFSSLRHYFKNYYTIDTLELLMKQIDLSPINTVFVSDKNFWYNRYLNKLNPRAQFSSFRNKKNTTVVIDYSLKCDQIKITCDDDIWKGDKLKIYTFKECLMILRYPLLL